MMADDAYGNTRGQGTAHRPRPFFTSRDRRLRVSSRAPSGGAMGLVAEGHTSRQIGVRLNLGEKTLKNHVSTILSKLEELRRR